MKTLRSAAALILTAALLLVCFAPAIHANGSQSSASHTTRTIDILDRDNWHGESITVVQRSANGNPAVSLTPDSENSKNTMRFYAEFETAELAGFHELAVDIMLRGTAEKYTVTAVVSSEGIQGEVFTAIIGNLTEKLYIPLAEDIAKSLDRIDFTVECTDGTLDYAVIYSVSADSGYTYKYKDTFMAEDVVCTAGKTEFAEDGIRLVPQDGTASVSPVFSTDTDFDSSYVLWITADGTVTGTVDVLAYDADGNAVPSSGAQALMQGSHTYAFIVKSAFADPQFVFNGLGHQTRSEGFSVTGAGVASVGKNYDQSAGSITSCIYKDGSVTVSGALSNEASVKYVGSKLGLYAIPVWEDPEEFCLGEANATVSFSTRFSISCIPEENYACCMYQTVLITDDGNIPLGAPQFVNAQSPSVEVGAPVSALDGADWAGAFESNISSSVINIYTDRLFETDNVYSASLFTYGNKYFYFDSDYLSETEKRLTLAASAGVRVYIRLLSQADGSFAYDTGDRESILTMCAVASLLSSRFDTVRGFILGGDSQNSNNTDNIPDTEQTQKSAYLAAIFSLCVRSSGTAQEVYLPFYDSTVSDPSPLFAAIRYKMALHAKQSISVLYTCPADGDPLSTAVSVSHAASVSNACGYTADSSAAVWEAPGSWESETLSIKYIEYCRAAAVAGLRFAAMSVDGVQGKEEFYDSLKKVADRENIFSATVEQFSAIEENIEFDSRCDIWNFTNAYDTAGWVAGGGFSSAVSTRSAFGQRALTASYSGLDKAGILICRIQSPVNMTDTSLKITLGLDGDGDRPADIDVIVGGRDLRAEFSANAEYGRQTELICNISAFSGSANVDYVAIIVRGSQNCTAELSQVELCSLTLPQQELEARLGSEPIVGGNPMFWAAIIILSAVTVTLFIFLSRRRTGKPVRKSDKGAE